MASMANGRVCKARIVVLEDGQTAAPDIAALREAGFAVAAVAALGEQGLAAMAMERPEVAVLSAGAQATANAVEAIRQAQEQFGIPVIYLTRRADEATLDKVRSASPAACLSWPLAAEILPVTAELAIQRYALEKENRLRRAWLNSIVESIGSAVIATDESGRVQFLNSAAEAMTGATLEAMRNQPWTSAAPLFSTGSEPALANLLDEALKRGEAIALPEGLLMSAPRGYAFPVEGEIAPCRDAGGILGAVITLRDASARQKRQEELRQQHKLQAVGSLAAGVAHDFNNALTIILGSVKIVRDGLPPGSPALEAVDAIQNAATLASDVTRRLLAFSHKRPSRPAALPLNEVIRQNESFFRKLLLGTSVELGLDLAPGLPPIAADPSQIQQILLNLVTNARDAMPEGGLIEVATGCVKLPGADPDEPAGEYVVICVRDEGVGMDREVADRIFDPFFTTKAAGQGTGLGLSIVQSVASDLGGAVSVTSRIGVGTDFNVFLPACPEMRHELPRIQPAAPDLSTGHGTILLVEDDDAVRSVLRSYLDGTGYEVIEASGPMDALSLASTHRGPIHLLIADVFMPKMNGFGLAQRLAPVRPALKTLFVSGYPGEQVKPDLLPQGSRFLQKPFGQADLVALVREMLARQ